MDTQIVRAIVRPNVHRHPDSTLRRPLALLGHPGHSSAQSGEDLASNAGSKAFPSRMSFLAQRRHAGFHTSTRTGVRMTDAGTMARKEYEG